MPKASGFDQDILHDVNGSRPVGPYSPPFEVAPP